MDDDVRALDERRERISIRHARGGDSYAGECSTQVRFVDTLLGLGIRGVRKIVDDDDLVFAREKRARHVVADEPDPSGDDDSSHGNSRSALPSNGRRFWTDVRRGAKRGLQFLDTAAP